MKEEDEAEYIDVKEEIYRQPEVEKSAGIFFLLFDYVYNAKNNFIFRIIYHNIQ